jgi:hypothetical protein
MRYPAFTKTGHWIVNLLLGAFVWLGMAVGQTPAKPPTVDQDLTRSIDRVLKDIGSIQTGMTRAELLRVFTAEGGISTRDGQQFVYRRCPYIKVIVNFRKPADADADWVNAPEEEWNGDLIQSISKPFLEYSDTD